MPLFSCFTPFGLYEFSSAPSEAEKIYASLKASYTDPKTGQATFDLAKGTYHEAKMYAQAMALGTARQVLKRAGNQLRPETSYDQIAAHEERYAIVPGPDDSTPVRRQNLVARQRGARGPRYEAIVDGLKTILGSKFVAYRPLKIAEAFKHPTTPAAAFGLFGRPDLPAKVVRLLEAVTRISPSPWATILYSETNQTHVVNLQSAGTLNAVAQSFVANGGLLRSCKFFLKKTGAPAGSAVAKIYEVIRSGGVDTMTATVLATSDPFAVATLTGALALTTLTFSGVNQIELARGKRYAVSLEYDGGSIGNTVDAGYHFAGGTFANGHMVHRNVATWISFPSNDVCFYVLTDTVLEVAYENWNARDPDVQLAPGDVVCVDGGDWARAENVAVISSDGSGASRSFRAVFTKTHDVGTHATSGPLPLWMNTKRHVLVVVSADAAIDVAVRARVNDHLRRVLRAPTTWSIVRETAPGSGVVGPFTLGASPLGTVPIGAITI